MRENTRSDYGKRLLTARKLAGFTQTELAKKVGMSQSSFGEAETSGQGSSYTPQIAAACGVSAEWLATGEGEMQSKWTWPFVLLTPKDAAALNSANRQIVEKLALDLLRTQAPPTAQDVSYTNNESLRSQVDPAPRRAIPVKRVAFDIPGVEEDRAKRSEPDSIRAGKRRGH